MLSLEYKHIFLIIILYFYLFENNYNTIVNYCGLIFFPLYCIIDLYFFHLTLDKRIHHIFGILISLSLFFNRDRKIIYFITNYEISTEISTFYLILRENLENSKYKNSIFIHICNFLFIFYFLYYRIVKFLFIQDTILENIKDIEYLPLFLITFYGLFVLNLFWFVLIIKKIYKKICILEKSKNEKYIKIICSYSNCIMLPYIIYNIYYFLNIRYLIFYILNISIIVSSNLYHKNCYQNIKKQGYYTILDPNIYRYYNLDILLIKLNNYFFTFLFFIDKNISYNLFISLIYIFSHIYKEIEKPYKIYNSKNKQNIIRTLNDKIIIFNLLFQNILFVFYLFHNYDYNLFYFVFYNVIYFSLLIFVGVLKPFYDMNHILYHIISWCILYNSYNYIKL